MKAHKLVAVLALAALATPAFADIPDGRGGRTSPQAAPRVAAATAPHACCPRAYVSTPPTPASPAERKVAGEVAWMSHYGSKSVETIACYKMNAQVAPVPGSSAELKAVGHLGQTRAAATDVTRCCQSARCPMHRAS